MRIRSELIYEATISTVENTPETAAWLFESQLEQERPRDVAQPPSDGPQTVDSCLIPSRTTLMPGSPGGWFRMADESPQRLRFNRAARIKQGRDFVRTREGGERIASGCLIANWRRLPAESTSRLGVITSRRIGGAVVRSRARRLLREVFRLNQHTFCAVDLVLVARASIAGKGYRDVEKDFLTTLRRAKLLKQPAVERSIEPGTT
jgi:ribonuclease P protein component